MVERKEILNKRGYFIDYVEDPKSFYQNPPSIYRDDLICPVEETVHIMLKDKNESEIKICFGHNLFSDEGIAYKEVMTGCLFWEIAIFSINDKVIDYVPTIDRETYFDWKDQFMQEFDNIESFANWFYMFFCYNKDFAKSRIKDFITKYQKINDKFKKSAINDEIPMLKHKDIFMHMHNLTEAQYEYLLDHDSVKLDN